jgi:Fe-S cluster assembly protein SufD
MPTAGGYDWLLVVSLARPTVNELNASVPLPGRDEAFAHFERLPVPGPADESWRYVETGIDLAALDLPSRPGEPLGPDPFLESIEPSGEARLVDGFAISDTGGYLRPGVEILGLIPSSWDKFAAAHQAFTRGGVTVDVPRGRHTEGPLLIDLQAVTSGLISFPHIAIKLGVDAEAEVVLFYRGGKGTEGAVVPQVEIDLADNARLRLLAVQELPLTVSGIIQQRARLSRDASLRFGEVGLGARLGRLDLAIDLEGQGAVADIVGLFFGHQEQVLDYRMLLNHRGPRTTSAVLLKGAVEDAAQSVFSGLVRIEKSAIGASAFETNRNLVLSPEAKAHSVPNLEILCDDVICGHGSSVGPLEEEHLYYLQSRGLSRARAERLLVRGFFRQVIDRLPLQALETPLQEILQRRFEQARVGLEQAENR